MTLPLHLHLPDRSVQLFHLTRAGNRGSIARLAYLAPDITAAILDGRQPPAMSSRTLLMTSDLPFDWSEQRALLGMASATA
jgi:hypothetical protein